MKASVKALDAPTLGAERRTGGSIACTKHKCKPRCHGGAGVKWLSAGTPARGTTSSAARKTLPRVCAGVVQGGGEFTMEGRFARCEGCRNFSIAYFGCLFLYDSKTMGPPRSLGAAGPPSAGPWLEQVSSVQLRAPLLESLLPPPMCPPLQARSPPRGGPVSGGPVRASNESRKAGSACWSYRQSDARTRSAAPRAPTAPGWPLRPARGDKR